MPEPWQGLFINLCILAAAILVWSTVRDALAPGLDRFRGFMLGVVSGLCAILLMSFPFEVSDGLIFDFRNAILAGGALFGGVPAVLAALAIALPFRIDIGGPGVVMGSAGIIVSLLVGLAGRRLRMPGTAGFFWLTAFALAVALAGLATSLFLPRDVWFDIVSKVYLPSLALTFPATLLTVLALRQDVRRREAMRHNLLYRATIEALPDCLNTKDLKGRFVAVNPSTAAMMRADGPDALIGKTDFDFYPADKAVEFRAYEERVLASREPETVEQHLVFNDGGEIWVSTLKAPLFDAAGRLAGLITLNRDITEKRRLGMELESTRERLNDALDAMSDGLVLYDRDGRLLFSNERYRTYFPMTADVRMPGARYDDIMTAALARGEFRVPVGTDPVAWAACRRETLMAGKGDFIQVADGRWLSIRPTPVREGLLVVVSDVTERKQSEDAIKAVAAEYRALFENSVAGIFRSSPDGRMLRANPALARLNGYDEERELLEAVNDIAGEWYVDPLRRDVFKRMMGDDGRVTDFVSEIYRHKTRERIWISETAWTVFDGDGAVMCYEGTVVDITERKQAEGELAAANRKLIELASIDGLTGLANRRVFDERIAQEFARRRRDGAPLSLVLFDVDHFKSYNDTYGHLAGDDCLRFIARVFQSVLRRPADLGCRYGGEELVAILPNTDAEGARLVAEEFRRAVKGLTLAHSGSDCGIVSISAGVATVAGDDPCVSVEELIRGADDALYRAKKAGRDRVLCAAA